MRELVKEQLVTQLVPGMYLYNLRNFATSFIQHLDKVYRRHPFQYRIPWVKVHMEKLREVGDMLVERDLARENPDDSGVWYEVEPRTANLFMAYLAAVLGQLVSGDRYYPITENERLLNPFIPHGTFKKEANVARKVILEGVLPSPTSAIQPGRLAEFKAKYGRELKAFRREIEKQVSEIATIENEDARIYRLDHTKGDLQEMVEEISSRMTEEKKWPTVTFGDFCAIAGSAVSGYKAILDKDLAFGLVAAGFGLAPAVFNAFKGSSVTLEDKPLAYAAIARRQFATKS
ncbi:hypothetical protein [Geobacter sp. DSM 9736]|uniref:hypothetical protein n=1 Tax=Geobacter sp. DSM 9736 TaxID=1277350 RepID=UPI0012FD7932|nr:hypothetical protein [Geobacter sp. DSM 9736]